MSLTTTMDQARSTCEWLEILAADYKLPVVVFARQIGTSSALEAEIARYLVREGQADAMHDIESKRTPPPLDDTSTLRARVRARHYTRLNDYLTELRDREAEAALDLLIEQQ